jgi:AAHS family 4-hydroxybenzoate transporter-like MFS transporter
VLADRFGRKPLIIASTLLFGAMSLLCATAQSAESLGLYRFVAGVGLGGAIPNIVALVSEYAPKRVRSTSIVATFAGFPLGAVAGGVASSRIIPAYGWEAVFVLGGVLPLVMVLVALAWLPESIRFLARDAHRRARAPALLERAVPGSSGRAVDYAGTREHVARPARRLFDEGRAAWTVLLWLVTFTVLLLAYFMINWTPLLLEDAGVPHRKAILGVVALNLGGVIGSLVLGRISDRRGPFRILAAAFGAGALAIAALGVKIDSDVPVLMGLVFVIGLFVFGAQLNITALAANYYPLDMRSTGIGWSMGFGRVGSFVGPLVGGFLIAAGLNQGQMFLIASIPAGVACLLIVLMSSRQPRVRPDD